MSKHRSFSPLKMWAFKTITLALSVSLLQVLCTRAAANNTTCKTMVPFSPALIGKTFRMVDDCYRPSAIEKVSIFKEMFVYWPWHGSPDPCPARYVVQIRNPPRPPMITYLPSPDNYEPIINAYNTNRDAVCARIQRRARRRMFVNGESRLQFIQAVREIAEGLKRIKNFKCHNDISTGAMLSVDKQSKMNLDVDGLLTYFYGLSFSNGFCLA